MRHEKTRFTARDRKRVTFSTFRSLPLLDIGELKGDFVEQIRKAQRATGFNLYAWLILPDAVHLVMSSTAKQPVRTLLEEMKGRFATRMLRRFKEHHPELIEQLRDKRGQEHFWHVGGGEDETIRSDAQLTALINALHDEPVRRGLAASPTQYRWSSARWYAGERDAPQLPIVH